VAQKAESQELCFLADGDYRRFIQDYAPGAVAPGPIFDQAGELLGEHAGLPWYTIGQRRGVGIATGERVYVLNMDLDANALVVGPDQALHQRELNIHDVSYVAGHPPEGDIAIGAKIRSMMPETPATLIPLDEDRARLVFDSPVRAAAPGQAAVFYVGEVVVGGGIIS
jgi:tRNA-specific 2-thiouridylase